MKINRKKFVCAMIDADINTIQLAEVAGLSRATVSSIKNGKTCSNETLKKLATALRVKESELLND